MKVVVAPDSYKGSLTALEVAEIMKEAILSVKPTSDVIVKPMADGGEGTLDSLLEGTESEEITIRCTGPLGEKIEATYGITKEQTAIIEIAKIAGLTLVPEKKRDPFHTTTYGIGEVMLDALNRNCTSFIIGLGGSATNDGGLGMLLALGMEAKDSEGKRVTMYGKDLFSIQSVDFSTIDPRLKKVKIIIASDVTNPLCGPNGASFIYGPQKGLAFARMEEMDRALDAYASVIEKEINRSLKRKNGAGAAGGLGFALLALGGEITSGAKLIAEQIQLEDALKHAHFVLTGEGKSDTQTLSGKAPAYVATLAEKHNVPVILISGSVVDPNSQLLDTFTGCFSIINEPMTLEVSMKRARELLSNKTKQITHFMNRIYEK